MSTLASLVSRPLPEVALDAKPEIGLHITVPVPLEPLLLRPPCSQAFGHELRQLMPATATQGFTRRARPLLADRHDKTLFGTEALPKLY